MESLAGCIYSLRLKSDLCSMVQKLLSTEAFPWPGAVSDQGALPFLPFSWEELRGWGPLVRGGWGEGYLPHLHVKTASRRVFLIY